MKNKPNKIINVQWLFFAMAIMLLFGNASKAQTPIADASRELRRVFAPCVNPNTDV